MDMSYQSKYVSPAIAETWKTGGSGPRDGLQQWTSGLEAVF